MKSISDRPTGGQIFDVILPDYVDFENRLLLLLLNKLSFIEKVQKRRNT